MYDEVMQAGLRSLVVTAKGAAVALLLLCIFVIDALETSHH